MSCLWQNLEVQKSSGRKLMAFIGTVLKFIEEQLESGVKSQAH
jgi:hypothetical protein